MIDIHSHILPAMDDGSSSIEESVQLLEESARQGVRIIAATPHFYAYDNNPNEFLQRRTEAADALRQAWKPHFPVMALGAEVHYFEGISRSREVSRLKLANTNLLLLEMPFSTWTERMLAEVQELQSQQDTLVLLAHIERYIAFQKHSVWRELAACGVKMQCNAEFFLNRKTKHKALQMLRQGEIQFIGSDCHNMTTRPPRLREAMEVIDAALGEEGRRILVQKAARMLLDGGAHL